MTTTPGLRRTLRDRRHRRLLLGALAGEEKALRRLYRELWPPIYRYVAGRDLPREDAEDITSLVFTRFLERLDRFDPARGSVTAWTLGIARHALLDHYRRRRPDRAQYEPLEQLARHAGDPAPDPLTNLINDEEMQLLHGLMANHPAEHRELFALRYGQGLSHKEIAALTGLGEAAVRQRFSRTLRELRKASGKREIREEGETRDEGEVDYAL